MRTVEAEFVRNIANRYISDTTQLILFGLLGEYVSGAGIRRLKRQHQAK